jgi:hypothetical protein
LPRDALWRRQGGEVMLVRVKEGASPGALSRSQHKS